MAAALETHHLVKQYPGTLAVDGVSFAVEEGTCFGLLGPNGAGKTTTVEIIEGVTRATAGLRWLCLAILPAGAVGLVARTYYALGDFRAPVRVSAATPRVFMLARSFAPSRPVSKRMRLS